MFLDDLSVKDKIEVLKELYKDIAELGVEGDTELAHINTFEANLLRKCGGSGTLNPNTGLPQYSKGGGGTPQATFQNTNQFSRIPDEVAPFASDVLTEAQDYYRMIMNQGYDPYTGAVTAPQTEEQTEAQAGLAALGRGGQGTTLQQEALDLQRQQGEKFTPEVAQEYMSPYQRAVTDIEKRKAVEDFERNIMPQFEAQAVQAGGMSGLGSRAGVQAGILGEGLQTRLGDIEAKGLQSSFLNAQQQFQNQKQREAAQAQQTANLGPAMFSQGLAQQGALQTVGEQKQNLGQRALDEQYFKFLEQKAFPEEQLAKYSGFVYGNPLLAQRDVTTAASAPGAQGPSTGQQLLGTGLAAASAFKQMAPQTFGSIGNFFRSPTIPSKTGGGLSDIVYRQEEGRVRPTLADRVRAAQKEGARAEAAKEEAQRRGATLSESQTIRDNIVPYLIPPSTITLPAAEKAANNQQEKEVVEETVSEKESFVPPVRYTPSTAPSAPVKKDREVDKIGTILMAISNKLLESKSGDPRDAESVRGGTLLRIADGLTQGTIDVETAEKELAKYELDVAKVKAVAGIDTQKRAAEILKGVQNYAKTQYSGKNKQAIIREVNMIASELALRYPTADAQVILSIAIDRYVAEKGNPSKKPVEVVGGKTNVKANLGNSALRRQAEAEAERKKKDD